MSRKSENSAANSAGDGDPVLSSFDNTPRKPEFGIAGPYGDHSLDPSVFIFKADNPNFTSDDDEFENSELKSEYLQRLRIIREKLASIDIANKSYYNECFACPPNQCKIIEITSSEKVIQSKLAENEEENHQENDQHKTKEPESNEVIQFDTSGLKPSSKEEILDLNYNPPKKKPCFRESTPKFTVSEGALYQSSELKNCSTHTSNKPEQDGIFKSPDHLFPEIKVEEKQPQSPSLNKVIHCNKCHKSISPDLNSRKSSAQEQLYLVFLDNMEQQQTPKSNHTVVTETTTTTLQSTPRVFKKRRLFLRSARNKVNPTDQMTLWEDLRTRDAMKKNENSASSKETFFESVLLTQNQTEEKVSVNVAAVGSLDVPRKEIKSRKLCSRFPSITKLTKLCPFSFGRKSKSGEEPDQPSKSNVQSKEDQKSKTANLLLKLKQRQDLSLEDELYTSSSESAESDFNYTENDDELEEYYQQFCLFCYCF